MPTALITGASSGIGLAIAEAFAAHSYHLILNCAHSKDALCELADRLRRTCQITCITCVGDVGDPHFVHEMFQTAYRTFGSIDVLVNNAGISKVGLFHDMSPEEWNELIQTNLSSVFYCCKEAAPDMIRRQCGSIINISSVWGIVGASCEAAYSASKGGVNALTRALAKELAPSGISVNAVACGAIDTRMNACFTPQERLALEEEIPCGRYGTPKEAAELVYSLATTTSYLTGQVIRLDGGWI